MDIYTATFVYTLLASIGGGIVQSTTGFGYGIFVMMFFPLYLPLLQASSLSTTVSLFMLTILAWKYRKYIRFKDVLFPTACYLVVSTIAIRMAPGLNLQWLTTVFAIFMIILAAYMLFFSQRIRLRPTLLSAAVCSSLSGAASGLFGIGGPPMTLYYMSLHGDDKYVYLGTLQCFFWLTSLVNSFTRFAAGLLTPDVLMLVIPGVVGMLGGVWIGGKIVRRISVEKFRLTVYLFLAIAGVITLIQSLT